MIKKIKFFGNELKFSIWFIIILIIEMTISMVLLNSVISIITTVDNGTEYYNNKSKDKSYVLFSGAEYIGDNTVVALEECGVDLSSLATTSNIGNVKYMYDGKERKHEISIVTPALINNFDKMGKQFEYDSNSDYVVAYAANRITSGDGGKPIYKEGNFYNIDVVDEEYNYSVKIKVVGIVDKSYFYDFSSPNFGNAVIGCSSSLIICDDITKYEGAKIQSGIFMNDKPIEYYKDLGFQAKSVEEIYQENKESKKDGYKYLYYMVSIILIFVIASIICNYVLNVDKIIKKRAVNYICGQTPSNQVLIEMLKMFFIFTVSLIINLVIIFVFKASTTGTGMEESFSLPGLGWSALITLGLYSISIIIGMVKFIRAKPINIINNEH